MRKIIILFAAASFFTACNNAELETEKEVVTTDSSSMYNSNASTDTATGVPAEVPVVAAPLAPAPKVITRTKTVYVDRTPKRTTQQNAPVSQPQSQSNSGVGVPPPGTGTSTSSTGTTTAPAPTEKKEGMSNATKGAVIGGVGGAVGGAIISKKKGKGAIIGGVIGAAGGYILGRKKDKNQADTTK